MPGAGVCRWRPKMCTTRASLSICAASESSKAKTPADLFRGGLDRLRAWFYVNVKYIYIRSFRQDRPGTVGRYRQAGLDRSDDCGLCRVVADRPRHLGIFDRERSHHGMLDTPPA